MSNKNPLIKALVHHPSHRNFISRVPLLLRVVLFSPRKVFSHIFALKTNSYNNNKHKARARLLRRFYFGRACLERTESRSRSHGRSLGRSSSSSSSPSSSSPASCQPQAMAGGNSHEPPPLDGMSLRDIHSDFVQLVSNDIQEMFIGVLTCLVSFFSQIAVINSMKIQNKQRHSRYVYVFNHHNHTLKFCSSEANVYKTAF